MKTSVKLLGALSIVSFALNVGAVDVAGKMYVKADVGGSIQQDISSQITGAKISFDPGVRADVGVGFHVNEAFAVEFETGFVQNSIDKIGGVSIGSSGNSSDWFQVPMLVNCVYTVPLQSSFKPYIGAGLGGVVSDVDFSGPLGSTSDTDVVFGYQGMAGVKYVINEQMDVGLGYKFLGTSDHNFSTFTGLNDRTFNHSLLASFSFRF